jgi:hypothetical protein
MKELGMKIMNLLVILLAIGALSLTAVGCGDDDSTTTDAGGNGGNGRGHQSKTDWRRHRAAGPGSAAAS